MSNLSLHQLLDAVQIVGLLAALAVGVQMAIGWHRRIILRVAIVLWLVGVLALTSTAVIPVLEMTVVGGRVESVTDRLVLLLSIAVIGLLGFCAAAATVARAAGAAKRSVLPSAGTHE